MGYGVGAVAFSGGYPEVQVSNGTKYHDEV